MICVACLRQQRGTNDADVVLNGDSLCLAHAEARIAIGDQLYAAQQERLQRLGRS